MVILLNQGNRHVLECVYWYRPRANLEPGMRMCHPAVWAYARERTDENRPDNLALLSCHSGDN